MKSLLVGNGIDIQFGGSDYFNANIIKRAIKNVQSKNFILEVFSQEILNIVKTLSNEVKNIVEGYYDKYVIGYEINILNNFKDRYNNINGKLEPHDIGMEDYFFINILFCRKSKISMKSQYHLKQCLRIIFLDSIYNNGKINKIKNDFPIRLKEFFQIYDNIFTTNYDKNIEKFIGKSVHYLHGAFHIKSEIYNPNSLINKISDAPINEADIIEGYDYIYSNALMTFAGEEKEHQMQANTKSNEVIEKIIHKLETNDEAKTIVDNWKHSNNKTVKNIYEIIKLRQNSFNFKHEEYYPIKNFRNIQDSIDIIGLSPNNDSHIFDNINKNNNLTNCNNKLN